jgi:general secretion pathway protein G
MIVRQLRQRTRQVRRAFTLMEILVVVAIIVVLAGIGGFYLMPQLDRAKDDSAKLQAKTIAEAVQTYYLHHNSTYPGDLTVLTQADDENNGQAYMDPEKIKDPWGKQYQLDTSGPEPVVFTTNPKGKRISNNGK